LIRNEISHLHLGASLYIPAIHKNLISVIFENKFKNLRSIIICLEDSILDSEVKFGEERVQEVLKKLSFERKLLIFIRPRNSEHLNKLLQFDGIEKIDGFVLPKFDLEKFPQFERLFESAFYFMPTFENEIVFDEVRLREVSKTLKKYQENILSLRIGSEDIGRVLGIKRDCNKTIHQIPIFSKAILNLIAIFKPLGFNLTSPVFSCFQNLEKMKTELLEDLENGLFGKTIIHPNQIDVVESIYQVSEKEFESALKILNIEKAISKNGDLMLEKKTHSTWAKSIVERANIFGVV
jgi:citrate lyase beta subunit